MPPLAVTVQLDQEEEEQEEEQEVVEVEVEVDEVGMVVDVVRPLRTEADPARLDHLSLGGARGGGGRDGRGGAEERGGGLGGGGGAQQQFLPLRLERDSCSLAVKRRVREEEEEDVEHNDVNLFNNNVRHNYHSGDKDGSAGRAATCSPVKAPRRWVKNWIPHETLPNHHKVFLYKWVAEESTKQPTSCSPAGSKQDSLYQDVLEGQPLTDVVVEPKLQLDLSLHGQACQQHPTIQVHPVPKQPIAGTPLFVNESDTQPDPALDLSLRPPSGNLDSNNLSNNNNNLPSVSGRYNASTESTESESDRKHKHLNRDIQLRLHKEELTSLIKAAAVVKDKEKVKIKDKDKDKDKDRVGQLYICKYESCGKVFTDAAALRKHGHVHGAKQFVCHYSGCGKRFVDSSKLKRHFLIHTGEKHFVCPFEGCGKAFSLDFNLRSHMRTHTGENYHTCPYQECGKKYAHEYKLKAHIKSHHEKETKAVFQQQLLPEPKVPETGERPFECPFSSCQKRYMHEYKLNLHLKKEHGQARRTPSASDPLSAELSLLYLVVSNPLICLQGAIEDDDMDLDSDGGEQACLGMQGRHAQVNAGGGQYQTGVRRPSTGGTDLAEESKKGLEWDANDGSGDSVLVESTMPVDVTFVRPGAGQM
eukprot:jgi/Chlat1/2686/Chrsp180S02858